MLCEGGSRGHRRVPIRDGCVCALREQGCVGKVMSRVTELYLSECIEGCIIYQVGPGAQEEHTACVLEDPREDALASPHSPHSFIPHIQIEHPLYARLCPRPTDPGDPYLLLGLLPSIPHQAERSF